MKVNPDDEIDRPSNIYNKGKSRYCSEKFDQELKGEGLTLRLYPGLYTVNHWLHDERGNIRLRSRWMIANQ